MCIIERDIETVADKDIFAYKVVRKRNGRYEPLYRGAYGRERNHSLYSPNTDIEFDLMYQFSSHALGWNIGFGFCCFTNKEHAKHYMQWNRDSVLIRVKIPRLSKIQKGKMNIRYSTNRTLKNIKAVAIRAYLMEFVEEVSL